MKPVELEFGNDTLRLRVPDTADVFSIPADKPLKNPAEAIRQSLKHPIGSESLEALIRQKQREKPSPTAVIVVSDNTRPVPYIGEQGILEPVLDVLAGQGVGDILVLVATGTHRNLSDNELRKFLPERVFAGRIRIRNHDGTDKASLSFVGHTSRKTEVWINKHYLEADIKILTGLVEPHFMAGFSGGRKAVCPGVAGEAVTHTFHGAAFMAHEKCASMIMEGNPCHEDALEVAKMAGADFMVNVTIDRKKRLTGVFSGHLEQAHQVATEKVMATNAVKISREYDLVVTHAGFSGINHYQAAKACVEAVKAVKAGGTVILTANHTDVDPVGGPNYRQVLPLLREHGAEEFTRLVCSSGWKFVPEQWEVQMWARALKKLGRPDGLIYCSPQLTGQAFEQNGLSGRDGGAGIGGMKGRNLAEAMVQKALDDFLSTNPGASIAILLDGPYGVPVSKQRRKR